MDTKILVGVPTAEYARRADFYDYFNMLEKPAGTLVTLAHGQSPARNRNLIIQQAITNNCTHIMFLDDDVAFRPDLMMKLLAHDVDIVTGLYLMRHYPHQPIIFEEAHEDGRCRHRFLTPGTAGLIPIVACGLGACLIKTKVFHELEQPWIRLGELEKDHWCDDIGFFRRVREKGFDIWCDTHQLVGHFASVTVWPNRVKGVWYSTYDSNGKGQATIPQVYPGMENFDLSKMES